MIINRQGLPYKENSLDIDKHKRKLTDSHITKRKVQAASTKMRDENNRKIPPFDDIGATLVELLLWIGEYMCVTKLCQSHSLCFTPRQLTPFDFIPFTKP